MRKYKLNEHFSDELNEKSAYWLGFLYADGYVRMKDGKSGELKLKLKDTDMGHISKLLNDLECDNPIKCGVDKFFRTKKNKFNEVINNFVSEEEFCNLIKKNNLITFNKYVSYITFNKLSRFPRNPESEYNFKF